VPATPEALLKLLLELESPATATAEQSSRAARGAWKLVALTSLGWLVLSGITVTGFVGALERQDRQMERLLDRMEQPTQRAR